MNYRSSIKRKTLSIYSLFATDMAMDLGTANTLIYVRGKGIVLNEPSVVALDANTRKPLYVGTEAKNMYGKTPKELITIRPMKDGVIADFDASMIMISTFIKKVRAHSFIIKPKIIIGVPSGITQVEKKAVIESALAAGVRKVHLVEEPMAAAIGTRMPVNQSRANLIVDIGGGTTEVAIISMMATAYSESTRVAGDELDEEIVKYLRKNHNLEIGIFEAEKVKIKVGSAIKLENELSTEVSGRDAVTRMPTRMIVNDTMIRAAIAEPVGAIVNAIQRSMEGVTPEMAADICSRGIVLAGGGALIRGLGKNLENKLGFSVYRARDPLASVVRGVGRVLEEFDTFRRVIIN